MTLPVGLYDQLVTDELARRVSLSPQHATIDDLAGGEATSHLLDLLSRQLSEIMESISDEDHATIPEQAALIAHLLREARRLRPRKMNPTELPEEPIRRLRSISARADDSAQLPLTGLSAPWIFTASKASPTLFEEIRREATDCDEVDILVSFITMSGVRKLMDVFQRIAAPGADGAGRTRLRVLTTTYTGATEQAALDMLARLHGCTVKVSLDGRRTRLHAKAWMFSRRTGFGSAYIGSANLSGAALIGGLEWTVKITERTQRVLFDRAKAHFESLWEDGEFVHYQPDDPQSVAALRASLQAESGGTSSQLNVYFDIVAKQYQADLLEQLLFERSHGRMRNLVVAATGTGKTVMAALDYRRSVHAFGSKPRLLFVAHRKEILEQALFTYRAVLRDAGFGSLLVGSSLPSSHEHLFASIQSVTSQNLVAQLGADYWHTVVIDECHRIAAPQFDAFARVIKPHLLLGLTATPQRTDDKPLEPYFDMRPDGSPAVELNLSQALDLQLLAPFEYFGCNDETDFSEVPWNSPGELKAIDNLVTGNQVRARMIVGEWQRLTGNAGGSRALIFCVSLNHAKYMAEQFAAAGLPVAMLSGESTEEERRTAPIALAEGRICAIVTVDLYNEGIDIPSVDTLLFLRPTQSPLVFQQQLGRGLRLAEGKASCLVLDFVGRHRIDFRFDRLISAMTGLTRREVLQGVEEGFSKLPSGCHVHLERQARERILANLRNVAKQSWARLRTELQAYATVAGRSSVSLGSFLYEQEVDIKEIYRESVPSGWTSLRRAASLLPSEAGTAEEEQLSRALRLVTHVDDPVQLALMRKVAERGTRYEPSSKSEALRAQMLTHQIDSSTVQPYGSFIQRLATYPAVLNELDQLASVLETRSRVVEREHPGFPDLPLTLHARYERREILTAVALQTAEKRPTVREGVLSLKERKTQLLFVTLDKSEGFHDRIAYHDYAVSTTRFHWQTQNSAGRDTVVGQRYIESRTNGWRFLLFIREDPQQAFLACGPVRIISEADITGDRPMNIVWTLDVPLPLHGYRAFCVLKGI
jgi:superfamily II DNA or RNA helicase/HKD family nuclease